MITLKRKGEPIAIIKEDITPQELELIIITMKDLILDKMDFDEYSKFWICDYTLEQ